MTHPLGRERLGVFLGGWLAAAKDVLAGRYGASSVALAELTADGIVDAKPDYGDDGLCRNVRDVLPTGRKNVAEAVAGNLRVWARGNLSEVRLPAAKALGREILEARVARTEDPANWTDVENVVTTRTDAGAFVFVSKMTSGFHVGGRIYGDERTGGHLGGDCRTSDLTNAWRTDLSVKNPDGAAKRIFCGIRHGVCSAYGLAGRARREACAARAECLARLAFLSRREELVTDGGAAGTPDDPIPFNVTNVAILSPLSVDGLDVERELLRDQHEAFKALNIRPDPIAVQADDGTGGLRTVWVRPHVTMFSCAEEEPLSEFLGGTPELADLQKRINAAGLGELRTRVEDFRGRPDGDPQAKETVRRLMGDVERLLAAAAGRRGVPDLRDAASRITVIAYLIGDVPSFNCRNGLNGASRNDVEAKFLATLVAQNLPLPDPGAKLTPEQAGIHRDLTLHAGNSDILERNVGIGGYKIER